MPPVQVELTTQQQRALDESNGQPTRLLDPRTRSWYVLMREEEYRRLHEDLDDRQTQCAIRQVALQNAAGRMNDDDDAAR